MVSEMAVEDIEELAAQGITLSVREIVRLNALGCRCQLNQDSSSFFALPRCAFIGDLCFREPALGHEMWLDEVSRRFDLADGVTSFVLRAYALSRDVDELPRWHLTVAVRAALWTFARAIRRLTSRQVLNCLDWVTYGNDDGRGEMPVDPPGGEDLPDGRQCQFSAAAGVIREGQSIGLGISVDDARRMTRSELQEIIQRAYKVRGIDVDRGIRERCIGEYYATLESIKRDHSNGRPETQV